MRWFHVEDTNCPSNPISLPVLSGLRVFLDAGNRLSYSGSGSTWFDLSGNSNNCNLFGSPTFDCTRNGVLSFNGINQWGEIAATFGRGDDFTIISILSAPSQTGFRGLVEWAEIAARRTGISFSSGRLVNAYNAATNTFRTSTNPTSYLDGVFRWFSGSNSVGDNLRGYVDNNIQAWSGLALTANATTLGTTFLCQYAVGADSFRLKADVGVVLIYNRKLTSVEIDSIYASLKTRYSLP